MFWLGLAGCIVVAENYKLETVSLPSVLGLIVMDRAIFCNPLYMVLGDVGST
jgi:hypothetical protein